MTKLIIARHGNTFGPENTPTRVGARTDLPLVESGRDQARNIGHWMQAQRICPDVVYSSSLRRTIETAEIAIAQTPFPQPVFPLDIFNEIDYGPDENQPEEKVIERLGPQAIKDWDERAIVPEGWVVSPDEIIQNWQNFTAHAVAEGQDSVMVVTSNGIARFAPHILGDFEEFAADHKIKLSTGALAVFEYKNGLWGCSDWNFRPNPQNSLT